ncbi:MAG: helix-turn-helix domain-containing protein [Parachlamydiales bacterium]|jgi:transcriptional regulator with XRE-family HTH domain
MRKSEKLLLLEIFKASKNLQKVQQEIFVGQLIALIRKQLNMSQRVLAKKSKVYQSTISRIESRALSPNIDTLNKLFKALSCSLIVSAIPFENLEKIKIKQAYKQAKKKVSYLLGTMALEKQKPDQKFIDEQIEVEKNKLINSKDLWDE